MQLQYFNMMNIINYYQNAANLFWQIQGCFGKGNINFEACLPSSKAKAPPVVSSNQEAIHSSSALWVGHVLTGTAPKSMMSPSLLVPTEHCTIKTLDFMLNILYWWCIWAGHSHRMPVSHSWPVHELMLQRRLIKTNAKRGCICFQINCMNGFKTLQPQTPKKIQ